MKYSMVSWAVVDDHQIPVASCDHHTESICLLFRIPEKSFNIWSPLPHGPLAHGLVDLFQVGDGHHIAELHEPEISGGVIGLEDRSRPKLPVGDTGQMIQEGRTVQKHDFLRQKCVIYKIV